MRDKFNEMAIESLQECYDFVTNRYDLTCKRCGKKITTPELWGGIHFCSTGNTEEADLIMKCKKCNEVIWDNYEFTEIGKNHKCEKDDGKKRLKNV